MIPTQLQNKLFFQQNYIYIYLLIFDVIAIDIYRKRKRKREIIYKSAM